MPQITANGIRSDYDTFGSTAGRPLLPGHDLTEPLRPEIVRHIAAHTARHHPGGGSR